MFLIITLLYSKNRYLYKLSITLSRPSIKSITLIQIDLLQNMDSGHVLNLQSIEMSAPQMASFTTLQRPNPEHVYEINQDEEGNNLTRGSRKILLNQKDQLLPDNRIVLLDSFLNLLPLMLFHIITKNIFFYYLCVGIINAAIYDQIRLPVTLALLVILVLIYLVKQYMTSFERVLYDRQDDARITSQWQNGGWVQKKWGELKVGSIIKLKKGETFPADIVPLYCKGKNSFLIRTYKIDKEIKTILKQIHEVFAESIQNERDLASLSDICLNYEDPNNYLYNFEGHIQIDYLNQADRGLSYNNFIMRGSDLASKQDVIGVVVYTGKQCKIYFDIETNRIQQKISMIELKIKSQIKIIMIIIIIMTIIDLLIYVIVNMFYSFKQQKSNFVNISTLVQTFRSFVHYSNLIHISLYIFLEIIRIIQNYKVKTKLNLKINNHSKPIDQFGQTEIIVTDQSTLRDEKKYKLSDIFTGKLTEDQLIPEFNMLTASVQLRNYFYSQAVSIEKYLRLQNLYRESGFKIDKQIVAKNKRKIFIFCSIEKQNRWAYYLISIGITQEVYSNLNHDETHFLKHSISKIQSQRQQGARCLVLSFKQYNKQYYMKKNLQKSLNISGELMDLHLSQQEQMQFGCVMLFKYTLQTQITNFVNQLKAVNIKLWVITQKPFEEIEDLISAAQILNADTAKYIIEDQQFNELTQHLAYIIGNMRQANKRKEAIVFITSDALQHIQSKQIEEQLQEISKLCFAMICFNSNNYHRQKLFSTFRKQHKGILIFSKYLLQSKMILNSHLSVSTKGAYSARICDFEIQNIDDIRKLIFVYGARCFVRNSQFVIAVMFKNTILVVPSIMYFFGLTYVQPELLYYQIEFDLFNFVMTSLPIVYYACSIIEPNQNPCYQSPSKIFSAKVVWKMITLATVISILITFYNYVFMLQALNFAETSISTMLTAVLLSNAYVVMISPNQKPLLIILNLISYGLTALIFLGENSIVVGAKYVEVGVWSQNKYYQISCYLLIWLPSFLITYGYVVYTEWENNYLKQVPERQRPVVTRQASCRLSRDRKGRMIKLQEQ